MDRAHLPRSLAALLAAVVAVIPHVAPAQPAAWGPLALALAGTTTARDDGRLAGINPAAAGAWQRLYYAEGAVGAGGLPGLGEGSLVAVHRIDSVHAVSASVGGVGFGSYRLVTVASSTSMRITDALAIGASVRLEAQTIAGYSTSAAILLDAGASFRPAPSATVAVAARNVTGARLRDIARPQVLSIASCVALDDSVDLSLELRHEAGRGVAVGISAAVDIADGLEARAGLRIDGSIIGTGFGYEHQGMLVDIALAWIEALGARVAVGVGTRW